MKYLWLLFTVFFIFSTSKFAHAKEFSFVPEKLKTLEKNFDGKIGVYAVDTNNNQIISYRSNERFPVQSTMKLIGVSALLSKNQNQKKLLQQKIHYTANDLIEWHPITGKFIGSGMTLEELSEAAISYSDNGAINLIIKKLGGPRYMTDFAHSIGNKTFNVEHYDGELNSDPKKVTDTSTPKDMATSLQKLTLGNILSPDRRAQLVTWMRNNTTGNKRIRAGVPIGWVIADKTGSGEYGIANDIGILWSPLCKPIVLAIYTIQNKQNTKKRDDIVAATTSIVLDEFAKNNSCFAELNK